MSIPSGPPSLEVITWRMSELQKDVDRVWEAIRERDQKAETDHQQLRTKIETEIALIKAEVEILKEFRSVYSEPIKDTILAVRALVQWRDQWQGRIQAGGAVLIILSIVNVLLQIFDRMRGP